jgi:RNA polymerase sigma-70 factor (ECF subfamily)
MTRNLDVAAPAAPARPRPPDEPPDAESLAWVRELHAGGAVRDAAVARLHALLLRAARFEVGRRRPALPHLRGEELGDIATQAADDALMSVLRRLDDYRGASRFTTWAFKFALLEAAVKLRRRSWQGREVPIEPEAWALMAASEPDPADDLEQAELLEAIEAEVRRSLTDHQREVLVALALNGVPIDVLAERLGTTRGALYKTLHDARKKLRARLGERDLLPDWLERPLHGGAERRTR